MQMRLATIPLLFLATVVALCLGATAAERSPRGESATKPASAPGSGPVIKTWEEMKSVRVPVPTEFASIFTFGYMNDVMPKSDEQFEKLLVKIKEGGFNVVHCAYTDKRLELCRKHGVKMMIDLLCPPHRFFTNRENVKALCIKLRNDSAVWGYNLWNDRFGPHGPGLNQRMVRIRTWDPTHPTFAGTYCTSGIKHLKDTDCFGYYDYHWTRGRHKNFLYLTIYRYWAMRRKAIFCRWVKVNSGKGRDQIYRRNLYTINTSIACGLKGALWFLGQNMLKGKTPTWTAAGQGVSQVNREVMPLRTWIMKIDNPIALSSTTVRAKSGKAVVPKSLPGFPKDFWLQPEAGEFLMGAFQDKQKRDYVFLANHSTDAAQDVKLKSARPVGVELFDRKEEKWRPLEVKDGQFTFKLPPAAGELLRFEHKKK